LLIAFFGLEGRTTRIWSPTDFQPPQGEERGHEGVPKKSASLNKDLQELAKAMNRIRNPALREIVTEFVRMLAIYYDGSGPRPKK
jgi:hypothetical protein